MYIPTVCWLAMEDLFIYGEGKSLSNPVIAANYI